MNGIDTYSVILGTPNTWARIRVGPGSKEPGRQVDQSHCLGVTSTLVLIGEGVKNDY